MGQTPLLLNRGFVVAGLADTQKPESNISPNMTGGESYLHVRNEMTI